MSTIRTLALNGALLLALGATAPPAMADPALAAARSCMACHALNAKMLGPSLHDVAERYRARPDAAEFLAQRIRQGSAGVWGSAAMPAQAQLVNLQEARQLAAWILTLQ